MTAPWRRRNRGQKTMKSCGKRWMCRTVCASIFSALVLSLTGCAGPSMPLERQALPETLLAPELPDARVFSEMVSSYLATVEHDYSSARESTTR
nr:MAG TPA: putative peptidyl-prolyl cis-trans isomerase [Caudoviricetes sp.]